jgi:hypothetical protein
MDSADQAPFAIPSGIDPNSHALEIGVDLSPSCRLDVPKSCQSAAALVPTAGAYCENRQTSVCRRYWGLQSDAPAFH